MINYTAGAGRGMMPKSCQLITASLYQTIWVLGWGRMWERILRRRQMLLMCLCVYKKLVVYAMIKKGKIYALRNFFLLSFPPLAFAAHAWWNYKENLCLINFSLPLIYDFSLCFTGRDPSSCWVLLGGETRVRFSTRNLQIWSSKICDKFQSLPEMGRTCKPRLVVLLTKWLLTKSPFWGLGLALTCEGLGLSLEGLCPSLLASPLLNDFS